MVLNRGDDSIKERRFYQIIDYFFKGDCLGSERDESASSSLVREKRENEGEYRSPPSS